MLIRITAAFALAACLLTGGLGLGQENQPVADLRKAVEMQEREVARIETLLKQQMVSDATADDARRQLAEARGRLAQAEGDTRAALDEFKKVVGHLETRVKRTEQLIRTGIAAQADLDDAEKDLAEARLRVATLDHNDAAVRDQLRLIAAWHAKRVDRLKTLMKVGAAARPELDAAEEQLRQATERLRAAERAAPVP